MSNPIIKRLMMGTLALLAGAGIAYAAFVSNTVTLTNTTVTTGEASLKICESTAANKWANSLATNLAINGLIPGEERNVTEGRNLYLGNDHGGLQNSLGGTVCNAYLDTPGHSNTQQRISPTVSFTADSCPDPLTSNLKMRFEFNGTSTDAKTMNAWASNTTAYDPVLAVGQAVQLKAYTSLSSTGSLQNTACNFTINLTGKQPTT